MEDSLEIVPRMRHILDDVFLEFCAAGRIHAPLSSAHEAYSVILEELEEFWLQVKRKRSDRDECNMRRELIQTAAMCLRAIYDLNLPAEQEGRQP